MARADSDDTTNPSIRCATERRRLSAMFADPYVRDAFERAERDLGDDLGTLVEVDHPPRLDGGAAEHLTGSAGRRILVEG